MIVKIDKSFAKDVHRIRDQHLIQRITTCIRLVERLIKTDFLSVF